MSRRRSPSGAGPLPLPEQRDADTIDLVNSLLHEQPVRAPEAGAILPWSRAHQACLDHSTPTCLCR